jgi:hypothetical protein
MDVWIWLLVAVLALLPRRAAGGDPGFDRVRSVALLFGLIYLIGQAGSWRLEGGGWRLEIESWKGFEAVSTFVWLTRSSV